jgi:hypothetical protein
MSAVAVADLGRRAELADEARAHHRYQVRRNEGVAIGQGLDYWQERDFRL